MFQHLLCALLCVMAVSPFVLHAQSIYKCRDGNGTAIYQSSSCAAGSELRHWENTPRPDISGETRQQRNDAEARIERDRRSVRVSNARMSGRRSQSIAIRGRDANACDKARARREATLQRIGLKRTYAHLRPLDDAVFAACQ